MKIAVVGAQCVGKSTFINDFVEAFPMYEKAKGCYRARARAEGLELNQKASIESQDKIRKYLIEQIDGYIASDKKHVIFDRCVLDNLAYTFWHAAKNNTDKWDEYMVRTIWQAREELAKFDILFYIPVLEKYPVEIVDDNRRDTDPVFRQEIDNIFRVFFQSYANGKNQMFDINKSPAMIEIYGDRASRIEMAKLYVQADGEAYGTTGLSDLLNSIEDCDDAEKDLEAIKEIYANDKIVKANIKGSKGRGQKMQGGIIIP